MRVPKKTRPSQELKKPHTRLNCLLEQRAIPLLHTNLVLIVITISERTFIRKESLILGFLPTRARLSWRKRKLLLSSCLWLTLKGTRCGLPLSTCARCVA